MTSCGEHKTPPNDGKISNFLQIRRNSLQGRFATSTGTLQRRINPSAASKFDQLPLWSTIIRVIAISAQQALWHLLQITSSLRDNISKSDHFRSIFALSNVVRTSENTNSHYDDIYDNVSFCTTFVLFATASRMNHFPPMHPLFITKFSFFQHSSTTMNE